MTSPSDSSSASVVFENRRVAESFEPGADQPLDDHRDDQITLTATLAAEQPLQVQVAQHAEDRGDVAVRERPLDLELLVEIDQPPAGEHRADPVDHLRRQMREVPDVLVADLARPRGRSGAAGGRVLRPVLALRVDCGYVS